MRWIFVLLLPFLTSACVTQDNNGKDASAGKDVVSRVIYDKLLSKIDRAPISTVNVGASQRPGQKTNYRDGIGAQYKALSACLVWKSDTLKVDMLYSHISGGSSYSYVEVHTINECERFKRQKSANCKCQMLDHDGRNVLDVPDEFRKAYLEKQRTADIPSLRSRSIY